MIRVESLKKSYGKVTAVDRISFDIKQGEAFGLLGPNGAGKTTTLSMVVGLVRPDEGSVSLDDGSNTAVAETRRRIGIAPQSLSLYDELTADENLGFFGRLYDLSGKVLKERIDWCIDFASLGDRRRSRVKTFSGGMKRRLNFAAALIHSPEIVLLDEPTVGVDPQSRNHLFESIEGLKREGLTIIYTTHYMEEAQRLCDRVAVMDHGKILDMDTVDRLIATHGGDSVVAGRLLNRPTDDLPFAGNIDESDLRFESAQPLEQIGALMSDGWKFESVQISQPDLESVFLKLTGRSLRDS